MDKRVFCNEYYFRDVIMLCKEVLRTMLQRLTDVLESCKMEQAEPALFLYRLVSVV